MSVVNVQRANSQLSRLVAEVEAGGEVVIARGGEPVARLVPYRAQPAFRQFGAMRDRISVGDEILDPLPEDELAAWD